MADESRQNLLSPSETLDLEDSKPVTRISNRFSRDLALLLSVGINVVLLAFLYFRSTEIKVRESLSPYAGLSEKVLEKPYWHYTEYSHQNETYRDELWESINTDRVIIALDHAEATALGLPQGKTFPWDENKSLYSVDAYHRIHCLKLFYGTIQNAHRGNPFDEGMYWHLLHCLDYQLSDTKCKADDTLSYIQDDLDMPAGQGQIRKCQDFSKLDQWALEHSACHSMAEFSGPPFENILWRNCPPDSPYGRKMREFFGYDDDWTPEFGTYFGPAFAVEPGRYDPFEGIEES